MQNDIFRERGQPFYSFCCIPTRCEKHIAAERSIVGLPSGKNSGGKKSCARADKNESAEIKLVYIYIRIRDSAWFAVKVARGEENDDCGRARARASLFRRLNFWIGCWAERDEIYRAFFSGDSFHEWFEFLRVRSSVLRGRSLRERDRERIKRFDLWGLSRDDVIAGVTFL